MRRRSIATTLAALALGAMLAATFHQEVAPKLGIPDIAAPPAGPGAGTPQAAVPSDPCSPVIAGLNPRQQLAQLIQVGVKPESSEDALAIVNAEQVGGIFIGGDAPGLLTGGALALVRAASKLPITVSVDDEGGRVQRIDALEGDLPSARALVAANTPEQVRELAKVRGGQLRARGVTMDLAPVVDTSSQPDDTVIGDRSWSDDPAVARKYAEAFAAGLRDSGVQPVLKHFPGHGGASGDSHQGLVTTAPLADLKAKDLVPYQDIKTYGQVAVMVGHLDVPDLTGGQPATLSPAAYQLLRKDYAFDGMVMTDDLGAMKAVTNLVDLPEAVRLALAAGADVALWSTGGRVGEVLDGLEKAVADGGLPKERVADALHHVLRSKGLC
ncbi:glycoside hydrolase family 3 N-terminal domain-containing protein [Umezawaea sp. Da 62-37]|nr:glycoside hydrolase family 3 N-terminal domain-containing protein [Umezawaea sp. Da 62-37]WNV83993.1 glycoside hydrolase family 3 N-terminal domain-containing protein [Umezawaea sp. Da 62-37]